MGLVTSFGGYSPSSLDPLSRLLLVRIFALRIQDLNFLRYKRTVPRYSRFFPRLLRCLLYRHSNILRERNSMLYHLLPSAVLPYERHRGGEYTLPTLSSLHSARCKGFPFADVLHVVHDWYFGIACENKIAVHTMDCEVAGDGSLGRREALRYHGAAIDSAGSWRVPEGSRIGEYVLD